MTLVSARARAIEPFKVVEVLGRARELESEGRSVVHLEVGEPDFETAPMIVEAGVDALRTGRTKYTQALGIPELREAIAARYAQLGVSVDPMRIAVTTGASGALAILTQVLVDPGDEVLLSDPGYPCNATFVETAGGVPKRIPVGAETRYQLNLDLVRKHWSERSKGVFLAGPSNPTGTLVDRAELEAMVEFCESRGGFVLVDEIYQGLVYDGSAPNELTDTALGVVPEVFVVNSFSKYFGMTGWRIGWCVIPEHAVEAAERVAQNLYIAPPAPSQYAALRSLDQDAIAVHEERRALFAQRRDVLLAGLAELGFDLPVQPVGAFYAYAGLPDGLDMSSESFCRFLIEEYGVAVTPGTDFGSHRADEHVRFAFTTATADIVEGLDRMRTALGKRGV